MKLNYVAAALLMSAVSFPAFALDEIFSPNVEEGEIAIEYGGSTTFDHDNTKNNDQTHEVELEWGVTNRLKLELEGTLENPPGDESQFVGTEIGGIWQFFEQGENWLDSGLRVMYVHAAHSGDADAIEAKLLLQKQTGKFLHTLNLGLEEEIGSNAQDGPERSLAWSSRYLYSAHFEPGIEIQSDFGRAQDHAGFNDQEHFVGPAAYGQIAHGIKYQAAYLFGVSDASPRSAARILLEYELHL